MISLSTLRDLIATAIFGANAAITTFSDVDLGLKIVSTIIAIVIGSMTIKKISLESKRIHLENKLKEIQLKREISEHESKSLHSGTRYPDEHV